MMNQQEMERYIKQHNEDVEVITKQIEEAKNKLISGELNNPLIKSTFERLIKNQEDGLRMIFDNHKTILELNGVG